MDIVLKSTTEVGESSRTYDSAIDVDDDGDDFTLLQIQERYNFDKVDIQCKVVKVREVNGGKFKQDITVGDHTGVGHVILWEAVCKLVKVINLLDSLSVNLPVKSIY